MENDGDGLVTVDNNATELTAEVQRLALGTWFLNQFKDAAANADAYISGAVLLYILFCILISLTRLLDFQFVGPLLVCKVLSDGPDATPSVTSEYTCLHIHWSQAQFVYWLLESWCTLIVTHYNYTLNFKKQVEQANKGWTIAAFVHFAYCYSNWHLVFADIQGNIPLQNMLISNVISTIDSLGFNEKTNKQVDILFDVMMHSITQYV